MSFADECRKFRVDFDATFLRALKPRIRWLNDCGRWAYMAGTGAGCPPIPGLLYAIP